MRPIYEALDVSSQSRTRVKLNSVFFVRFLVSPKFSRVPLGVGGWPLGYEERRSTNVRDGQTCRL